MKKLLLLSAFFSLLIFSCEKEENVPARSEFPYSNDDLTLSIVNNSIPDNFVDIEFFNEKVGIALSYRGKIYKTTDGGKIWGLQYQHYRDDRTFFDLHFVNDQLGYAVGGKSSGPTIEEIPGGIVLRSQDGGESWEDVLFINRAEIVAVSSNSDEDVFIVSNDTVARIMRSMDEGENWETVAADPNGRLQDLSFNSNTGYCSGGGGRMHRSEDNGTVWTMSTFPFVQTFLYEVDFYGDEGFCTASTSGIFKTNDNGKRWEKAFYNERISYNLEVLPNGICLATGSGTYSGGCFGSYSAAIRYTTNAGSDWTEIEFSSLRSVGRTSFFNDVDGYLIAGDKLMRITFR